MAKLYIICGHGAGDPGACAAGQTEEERVRYLASRIKALGGDQVEVLDTSRNWYADKGLNTLAIPKDAMLLELHRDSFNDPNVKGAHVEIKSGYKADAFDGALARKLSSIFPGRSEIIKKRADLANANRAGARGINYRLAEVGFISNAEDRAIFDTRTDEIAQAILEAAGIKAGTTASAPTDHQPATKPTSSPSDKAGTGFGGKYRCTVDGLRIRTAPSLKASVVGSYDKGQTVTLDDWYRSSDGYIWGRYTAYSGNVRYVAVGKATGKPEPDDFLVKC